jgi:hypothetical protein
VTRPEHTPPGPQRKIEETGRFLLRSRHIEYTTAQMASPDSLPPRPIEEGLTDEEE